MAQKFNLKLTPVWYEHAAQSYIVSTRQFYPNLCVKLGVTSPLWKLKFYSKQKIWDSLSAKISCRAPGAPSWGEKLPAWGSRSSVWQNVWGEILLRSTGAHVHSGILELLWLLFHLSSGFDNRTSSWTGFIGLCRSYWPLRTKLLNNFLLASDEVVQASSLDTIRRPPWWVVPGTSHLG